jgi:acetylornithine/succinyldiaminopimelate/putrescine aminotransferase
LVEESKTKGDYFLKSLIKELGQFEFIKEIRGRGLFIGIDFHDEFLPFVKKLVYKMLDKGIICK